MISYYGRDLLNQIESYYGKRYKMAQEMGFAEQTAGYHWLYDELSTRLKLLRQVHLFLEALPLYLPQGKSDDVISYVTQYVSTWFQENDIGTLPNDADGHCVYFKEENPYWMEISEVMNAIEKDTDYKVLPLFHVQLCEYVVRNVRLYFFLREKQKRAIDREKFDQIMQLESKLTTSA